MHAEPVLAVYAGYSLKGAHVNPGPDLELYVEDALDEIEYATGPATSRWGSLRARAGHPAPFRLTYVEVGNEDWFDKSDSYDQRFAQFNSAIKARYPKLHVISTVGFEQPEGARVHSVKPDVLDEHYYRTVDVFLKMARGTDVLTSVTRDSKSGTIYPKLVNASDADAPVQIILTRTGALASTATALTLSADPQATNTIDTPERVVPVTSTVTGVKSGFTYTVPKQGIVVLTMWTR